MGVYEDLLMRDRGSGEPDEEDVPETRVPTSDPTSDPSDGVLAALVRDGSGTNDAGETSSTPVVRDRTDQQEPAEESASDFQQTVASACSNNIILDKRIQVFRDKFEHLWVFWTDSLMGQTANKYSIYNAKGENGINTAQVSDEESVLFFITNHGGKGLSYSIDGVLDKQVYWAVYYDVEEKVYKPIVGVKYFDIHYSQVTGSVDLVFWANINADELADRNEGDDKRADDLYPDFVVDSLDSSGAVNTNAQRMLFHAYGKVEEVVETRTGKDRLREMFIFDKPHVLRNPGVVNSSSRADPVVDIMVGGLSFVEFS